MRQFTVYAPAKLNLYLDVLEKRPDGYHNIETLFEKIDLKDEIVIKEKAKGLDIEVEPINACPSGKDNIVNKALRVLFEEAGAEPGIDITIRKNIPVSAGLGGGSSDAAAALRAVNDMFELGVPFQRLFSIAAGIGKDIPFFMLDAPFAIGKGTGEDLEPIETDSLFSHVVARPNISISTAEMYQRLDNGAQRSKKPGIGIGEVTSAIKKKDLVFLEKTYYNIFEEILVGYSQYIDKAKILLSKAGAGPCFLSGSGPSVFSTMKSKKEAMKIFSKIPREKGIDIFLVTTQMRT